MNKRSYAVKEKVAEVLDLPKDIVLDAAKIIVVGNNQMQIENHKGIIEFDDTIVRINTGSGIISVIGKRLCIKSIIQEEIIITGEIFTINL